MKIFLRLTSTLLAILPLILMTSSKADVLIDSFLTPQSAPGAVDTRSTADGPDIIGGERDIISFLSLSADGTVPNQLRIAFPNGLLNGRAGTDITYDGDDNDPSSSLFNGLGTMDLTQGGVNDRFRLDITSVFSSTATLTIDVDQVSKSSTLSLNLPQTPGIWDIPFASFQRNPSPIFTSGVDFHAVGYINFHFEMNGGESVTINSIITTVPEPSAFSLMLVLGLGLGARNFGRHPGFKKL